MVPMRIYKQTLSFIGLLAALGWLAGCSALTQYASVAPLPLTPAEQARIGAVVEPPLLQMLGGPYHDKGILGDLAPSLPGAHSLKISVADRSSSALYPLPGGRVIVTRGLLAKVNSMADLSSLLNHAMQLSNEVYKERATRSMVKTTEEVLSATVASYDPDSAAIRLARLFEQEPCVQACLAAVQRAVPGSDQAASALLPESIVRLSALQPGYDLVATARQTEQSGEQGKAIALYLQAAAITPDEPGILGALGLAYLRAGQLQPARLHLQKAARLQPDYYRTQMGLGYLYLQQGNLNAANQALAASVSMLPVPENLFLLAEAKEKSGDLEGGMSLYRLVLKSDSASKLGRAAATRLQQTAGAQ